MCDVQRRRALQQAVWRISLRRNLKRCPQGLSGIAAALPLSPSSSSSIASFPLHSLLPLTLKPLPRRRILTLKPQLADNGGAPEGGHGLAVVRGGTAKARTSRLRNNAQSGAFVLGGPAGQSRLDLVGCTVENNKVGVQAQGGGSANVAGGAVRGNTEQVNPNLRVTCQKSQTANLCAQRALSAAKSPMLF